jgi:predicted nucleic acid-binding Zn ribbon protein
MGSNGAIMAKYEYECELDGVKEIEFPIGTAPETAPCGICGDTMQRKFSTFRPIFKGDGWGGSK